jgi:hypothetical protein
MPAHGDTEPAGTQTDASLRAPDKQGVLFLCLQFNNSLILTFIFLNSFPTFSNIEMQITGEIP